MNACISRNFFAVALLSCLSLSPAFGDSALIKGSVQRNVQNQGTPGDSNNSEMKQTEPAPQETPSDPKAQQGAATDTQLLPDGQTAKNGDLTKELRDKTFQLQNSQSAIQQQGGPSAIQLQSSQSAAQLGVQQQSTLQARANGGEEVYGCLGAVLNLLNGAILKIFPQSDLNRLEVLPGDRIIGVNGHQYDFRTIIKEMVGTPGTIIEMDIQTPTCEVKHLQVRRTDARLLPQTGMYKQLTKRNRFW